MLWSSGSERGTELSLLRPTFVLLEERAMSEHEAELRLRLERKDDLYDTIVWFLAAIDVESCVDSGLDPDLSWFEREFLKDKDNIEFYREERLRRMTVPELLNEMAIAKPAPNQPS
jgi:hypothetical protein